MKTETLIIKALTQTINRHKCFLSESGTVKILEYFRETMLEMLAAERQQQEAEERRLVELGAEMSDPNL